ncbi:NAD(P)-binding protein [Mollisia scopiformis]|uniref:NAD(P)-binding protein n=1 Tax=Mollisia scopiformis TaxID=149040 RepID=A0A194X2B4_MOLSC|nr:NAD(P)-binding protein [Mollisia scopiformis]KUJ14345.1 NAD(P)-binding protein [Mollisia scopiformis]
MSSPSTQQTFLITGATGNQGLSTITALLSLSIPPSQIHALTRTPSSPKAQRLLSLGLTVIQADISHPSTLLPALQNITSLFILPFCDMSAPYLQSTHLSNLLSAAKAAGSVKHIVLSTVICAELHPIWLRERGDSYLGRPYYESKFLCEEVLRKEAEMGGWSYAIVRPGWYSNTHYVPPECGNHFPELVGEGVLKVSYGVGERVGHVDVRDVGEVVADALVHSEKWRGREVDVVGENLGIGDVAGILAEVMKELPGVFEVKITGIEGMGLKLRGLKETFAEGTEERRKLFEMWGLEEKKDEE